MELRVCVEKRFGDFALDADFTVAGERIGIFGESGSGKSTLVGLLAGLHEPDRGEIVLDGDCLFSSRDRINVPAERRHVAIVFQQPSLFPHLSVRSNLLYGYKRRSVEHRSVDFQALVDVLQLESLLSRGVTTSPVGKISGWPWRARVLASPGSFSWTTVAALGDGRVPDHPLPEEGERTIRTPSCSSPTPLVEARG